MARPTALVLTVREDTRELEELLYSLGYDVVDVVRQNRRHPDAQFFLGRGKLEEARARAQAQCVGLVVVNAQLKPNQVFNVSEFMRLPADDGSLRKAERAVGEPASASALKAFDVSATEVCDRLRVILEIFAERARSPEARLQVELAKLRYEMPIVKEYIHLARKGEHPGFLAGGEYEVTQYYTMMNQRLARIRRDLKRMSEERGVRRKHRRRSGFHLVSLAGYTNAGKSSLLRALSTSVQEPERAVTAADEHEPAASAGGHAAVGAASQAQTVRESAEPVSAEPVSGDAVSGDAVGAEDAPKTSATRDSGDADATPARGSDTRGRRGQHERADATAAGADVSRESPPSRSGGYAGEDIVIENRYFSTLATKTRRAASTRRDMLITDTVGFIEDLPPWLVDAFHSTLEEIALADVVLVVADASDPVPELVRKVQSSLVTLWDFDGHLSDRGGAGAKRGNTGGNRPAGTKRAGGSTKRNAANSQWPASTSAPGTAPGFASSGAPSGGAVRPDSAAASTPPVVGAGASAAASADRSAGSGAVVPEPTSTDARSLGAPMGRFTRTIGTSGAASPPVLVVLNKVDRLDHDQLASRVEALDREGLLAEGWVAVSARERMHLSDLLEAVTERLPEYEALAYSVPLTDDGEAFISWLHEAGHVTGVTRGHESHVLAEVRPERLTEALERARACGAEALRSEGDDDEREGADALRSEDSGDGLAGEPGDDFGDHIGDDIGDDFGNHIGDDIGDDDGQDLGDEDGRA